MKDKSPTTNIRLNYCRTCIFKGKPTITACQLSLIKVNWDGTCDKYTAKARLVRAKRKGEGDAN